MVTEPITSFRGEYAFLSNFYAAPVRYAGRDWPTSEHAYQAMKTDDGVEQERIRMLPTPQEAKAAGRLVRTRFGWEVGRVPMMRDIVRNKFAQNIDLAKKLVDTGDATLIEGNDWGDEFWGAVFRDEQWDGQNYLGRILMEVREWLREMMGSGRVR